MKNPYPEIRSVVKVGNETVEELPEFDKSYLTDHSILYDVDTFNSSGWDIDRFVRLYLGNKILAACRVTRVRESLGVALFFQRIFQVPSDADVANLEKYPLIDAYGEMLEGYYDHMIQRGVGLTLAYYPETSEAVAAWVIGRNALMNTHVRDILEEQKGHLINIERTYHAAMKRVWNRPAADTHQLTNDDIAQLRKELSQGIADLKRGQAAVYQEIGNISSVIVKSILEAVHQNRVEQGDIMRVLDAIRRTLQHIQSAGLPLDNSEIRDSINRISDAINSEMNFQQKLELSLPIIPFLLDYKLEFDLGVDLSAVLQDLYQRIHRD